MEQGNELVDPGQQTICLQEQIDLLRSAAELTADLTFSVLITADNVLSYQWTTGDVTQLTGGLSPSELESQGGLVSLVHPDDREIASNHIGTTASDEPWSAVFRIVLPSGEIRWIRDHRRILYGEDIARQPTRIVGAIQDISEEVCREQALQESKEKYRLVVDKARRAILVLQADRVVFANAKTERLTGFTLSELRSRPFIDFVHPDDHDTAYRYYQDGLMGATPTTIPSFRIIDRHEEVRWVETTAVLITWDGEPGLLTTLTDISRRRWAEAVWRDRSQALAELNHIGQQLTSSLDLRQIAEQLRQLGQGIFGAESVSVWLWEKEKEGWLVCWTALKHSDTGSPVNLRLSPGQGIAGWVAQTGESVISTSPPDDPRFFPGIDHQINYHTHSLIAVPLQVQGSIIGVMEVVNKVEGEFDQVDLVLIENLAASAAIAIRNAQLIDELYQRTLELDIHNQDLNTFTDTVAHDLKSLLTRVIIHSSLLESDLPDLPRDLRRHLEIIRQYAYSMGNIVDALLLLATVREASEIEMDWLDMEAAVDNALGDLASMILEYDVQIIQPDMWPKALGYQPWVERVWVNYLSNAIRYGGCPPVIELGSSVSEDSESVRFWVRDNGPGISQENKSELFSPFPRIGQTRKGHGLGLSIVRRIVEKLGGQVGVESEEISGQGSTFFFVLPCVVQDQSEEQLDLFPER
jgi:PAS domain S-box-containing protein